MFCLPWGHPPLLHKMLTWKLRKEFVAGAGTSCTCKASRKRQSTRSPSGEAEDGQASTPECCGTLLVWSQHKMRQHVNERPCTLLVWSPHKMRQHVNELTATALRTGMERRSGGYRKEKKKTGPSSSLSRATSSGMQILSSRAVYPAAARRGPGHRRTHLELARRALKPLEGVAWPELDALALYSL